MPRKKSAKPAQKNKWLVSVVSFVVVLALALAGYKALQKTPEINRIGQGSRGRSVSEASCTAGNNEELRGCLKGAESGNVSIINIAGTITCSQATPCNYTLSNITSPALVIQNAQPGSGFQRTDDPSQWVFRFVRGNKVMIQNLTFRDTVDTRCATVASADTADVNKCAEVLLFQDMDEVVVNNITMENINRYGILVYAFTIPPHYTIQNSRFKNIGLHAIHTLYKGSVPQGGVAKILNNNFDTIKSSAFNLNVNSSKDNPSIVRGNIINKTHNTGMYACRPGECGDQSVYDGGQVFLYSPYRWDKTSTTQNVLVENNYITNGVTQGIRVWGLEILALNVRDVTIRNNIFFNNNAAVLINPNRTEGEFQSQGVLVENNVFTKNTELVKTFPFNVAPRIEKNITTIPENKIFDHFLSTRPQAPAAPAAADFLR